MIYSHTISLITKLSMEYKCDTIGIRKSGTRYNGSIRCIGITKKKIQCARNGANGTKYCSNHKTQNPENRKSCNADTKSDDSCSYEANIDGLCTRHLNLLKKEEITKKVCTTCKESKLLKDFNKDRTGKAGKASKCRQCSNSAIRILNYPRKVHGTKVCGRCKNKRDVSCLLLGKRQLMV